MNTHRIALHSTMGKADQTTRRDRHPIRERKVLQHFALGINYENKVYKCSERETAKRTDCGRVHPHRFSYETIHFSEFSDGRFSPAFLADRSLDFFAHRLHIFRIGSKNVQHSCKCLLKQCLILLRSVHRICVPMS